MEERSDAKNGIERLLVQRESNVYVFANSTSHVRGCDAVRKIVGMTEGVLRPHLVKATQMRKLCATTLQLGSMNDHEFKAMCDHLGHTEDVHQQYYRQRRSTTILTKVARLLLDKKELDDIEATGNDTTLDLDETVTSNAFHQDVIIKRVLDLCSIPDYRV
jgi:hypothetical protein